MTGVTGGGDLGPYRDVEPHPITPDTVTLPGERIVTLGRSIVGDVPDVFYAPTIPRRKLQHARAAHAMHLLTGEPIAVLHDDTFFGSAKEGFLLTAKRLCWKTLLEPATQLPWSVIDAQSIFASGSYVVVMGAEIKLRSGSEISGAVASLLQQITEEAHAGARKS
jgi:hypothetical protein